MNKTLDIISKIGSIILSFILFFTICMYLSLDIAAKLTTKENISTIVKEVNIESLLKENNSNTMNELYKIADDNNIDRGIVDGVVNSKEFKELVGSYYGDMIEEFLYNGKSAEITSAEVVRAVNDALDRTANDLGYSISNEQRTNIINEVEKKADKVIETLPTYEKITKDFDAKDIEAIRIVFSNDSKIVLITIMIILTGIIALIRWSVYRFAVWSGTSTIIAGSLFILIGMMGDYLVSIVALEPLSQTFNSFIQNNITSAITYVGVVTVIVGIIQLVYYIIMRKLLDKKHA